MEIWQQRRREKKAKSPRHRHPADTREYAKIIQWVQVVYIIIFIILK